MLLWLLHTCSLPCSGTFDHALKTPFAFTDSKVTPLAISPGKVTPAAPAR